jgi:hypothetical protein
MDSSRAEGPAEGREPGTDGEYRPVAVQILTDDETLAALTSELEQDPAVTVSPARQVAPPADLNFDLAAVTDALSAVTAVITAARAAKQLVDLLVARIRKQPKPVIIRVGPDRIELSGDTDADTARRLLEAALHLVS